MLTSVPEAGTGRRVVADKAAALLASTALDHSQELSSAAEERNIEELWAHDRDFFDWSCLIAYQFDIDQDIDRGRYRRGYQLVERRQSRE